MTWDEMIEKIKASSPEAKETLEQAELYAEGYSKGFIDGKANSLYHIWNNVKTVGLPKEGLDVFIRFYRYDMYSRERFLKPDYACSSRSDVTYWRGIGRDIEVTHWMPIIDPKEEQEWISTD